MGWAVSEPSPLVVALLGALALGCVLELVALALLAREGLRLSRSLERTRDGLQDKVAPLLEDIRRASAAATEASTTLAQRAPDVRALVERAAVAATVIRLALAGLSLYRRLR